METTEVPVAARSRPDWSLFALAIIGAALVLHVLGMFPAYFSTPGRSLAAQPDQATLYGVVAGSWFLVLLLLFGATFRQELARLAAAAAVGVAAGEIGFRIADLGQALRSGTGAGVGLWLECAAWAVGAGGAALAVVAARQTAGRASARAGAGGGADPSAGSAWHGEVTRTASVRVAVVAAAAVTAIVTAVAFVPAWDRFLATVGATGQTVRLPSENAFSGPGLAVFGNAVVVAVLACLPIAAALLRRPLVGAVAIAGMLVSFVSQLLSAAVQSGQPVDPSVLRVSPAQASRLRLHIGVDLTGWYWAEIAAVVALAAAALWLALLPALRARRAARELTRAGGPGGQGWQPGSPWSQPPQWTPPGQPAPQWAPPGQTAPQWAPPGQTAPQWAPPGQTAPQWAPPGQPAPQWAPPGQPAPQWAPPGQQAPPAGGPWPAPPQQWAPPQPNRPAPHEPAHQDEAPPPAPGPPPPHWPPPSPGGAERSN